MSSQPWQSTMNVRPKGMPKPAKTKLLTPVDEPQRPPTWQLIMTPKLKRRPAWMLRSTVMSGRVIMRTFTTSPTLMTKPMTCGIGGVTVLCGFARRWR